MTRHGSFEASILLLAIFAVAVALSLRWISG
jgi:hypothetical protein